MSHVHDIVDTDSLFRIDPVTRVITTDANKIYVVQHDHNSERFTFQIPKYVDEHDMSLCNRIEVHYSNVTRNKKQKNDDVYIVKPNDYRCDDNDMFFFSWLITSNATQLAGFLKFTVTFVCLDDDGVVAYEWSTAMFEKIQVLTKLENAAIVRENYPDLYNQLKQEIMDSIPSSGGEVDPAVVERMVAEYLAANPPAQGEDGYTPVKGIDYFTNEEKQEIAEQAALLIEVPDSGINVSGAAVGQTIVVEEVDESGKPTKWKAADLPSGKSEAPSGDFELFTELTTDNTDTAKFNFSTAADGTALADKGFREVFLWSPSIATSGLATSGTAAELWAEIKINGVFSISAPSFTRVNAGILYYGFLVKDGVLTVVSHGRDTDNPVRQYSAICVHLVRTTDMAYINVDKMGTYELRFGCDGSKIVPLPTVEKIETVEVEIIGGTSNTGVTFQLLGR